MMLQRQRHRFSSGSVASRGRLGILFLLLIAASALLRKSVPAFLAVLAAADEGGPASAQVEPEKLFNSIFVVLAATCFVIKVSTWQRDRSPAAGAGSVEVTSSPGMLSLRWKFLVVFWLFKFADWLKGPYFYDVYASKEFDGEPASAELVAKFFLTGFLSSALLSPLAGRIVDTHGRKLGSILFAISYGLSAISVHCSSKTMLFAGRGLSGIGTAFLFSAPESWLVGEHERGGFLSSELSSTFALAYLGDAIVAILAGLVASAAASIAGPTAPFDCSVVCLIAGGLIAAGAWRENTAHRATGPSVGKGPTLLEAWREMRKDPRILIVGAVQALFEGAMYIFVMQWPPTVAGVLPGVQVPYGKVFSCFMACCMVGSSLLSVLLKSMSAEKVMAMMLFMAALAMGAAALRTDSLTAVIGGFFVYEACVGIYFPCIGILRGKYLPDSHRGMMMSLFRIPLNLIVVTVLLCINQLGFGGSMLCSCIALAVACGSLVAMMSCSPQLKA